MNQPLWMLTYARFYYWWYRRRIKRISQELLSYIEIIIASSWKKMSVFRRNERTNWNLVIPLLMNCQFLFVRSQQKIFKHLLKTIPFEVINKLTSFQEFMCILQKLRSNTPLQSLAYQFSVFKATVLRRWKLSWKQISTVFCKLSQSGQRMRSWV